MFLFVGHAKDPPRGSPIRDGDPTALFGREASEHPCAEAEGFSRQTGDIWLIC